MQALNRDNNGSSVCSTGNVLIEWSWFCGSLYLQPRLTAFSLLPKRFRNKSLMNSGTVAAGAFWGSCLNMRSDAFS
jgi:hypothetical protein